MVCGYLQEEKDNEMQASAARIAMIRRAVDTHQSLLQEELQQQQEEVEKRSDKLLREIQEEMEELRTKRSELQHIQESRVPLRLTQVTQPSS